MRVTVRKIADTLVLPYDNVPMERVQANQDRVCQLMAAFRAGDRRAANELVEIFQPELRRLAAAKMRKEDSAHSWQPTLLVNELYLEMVKVRALRPAEQDAGNDRAAFLSLAGLMMTRLLIHHSRPLSRKAERCEVDVDEFETPGPALLVEIDRLLERLESFGSRLRYIVELRVFEDLTGEEIAQRLGCGTATVARDWNFARRWLEKELSLAVRL